MTPQHWNALRAVCALRAVKHTSAFHKTAPSYKTAPSALHCSKCLPSALHCSKCIPSAFHRTLQCNSQCIPLCLEQWKQWNALGIALQCFQLHCNVLSAFQVHCIVRSAFQVHSTKQLQVHSIELCVCFVT